MSDPIRKEEFQKITAGDLVTFHFHGGPQIMEGLVIDTTNSRALMLLCLGDLRKGVYRPEITMDFNIVEVTGHISMAEVLSDAVQQVKSLNYGKLIGEKVTFSSPDEMLQAIQRDRDYYNVASGEYVWNYNESGSVCVYILPLKEAEELQRQTIVSGTLSDDNKSTDLCAEGYWGEFLGCGGSIFDDVSYGGFDPDINIPNTAWCEAAYNKPGWLRVDSKAVNRILRERAATMKENEEPEPER